MTTGWECPRCGMRYGWLVAKHPAFKLRRLQLAACRAGRCKPKVMADHVWVDCKEPMSTLCDPGVCHHKGGCDLPPIQHPKTPTLEIHPDAKCVRCGQPRDTTIRGPLCRACENPETPVGDWEIVNPGWPPADDVARELDHHNPFFRALRPSSFGPEPIRVPRDPDAPPPPDPDPSLTVNLTPRFSAPLITPEVLAEQDRLNSLNSQIHDARFYRPTKRTLRSRLLPLLRSFALPLIRTPVNLLQAVLSRIRRSDTNR